MWDTARWLFGALNSWNAIVAFVAFWVVWLAVGLAVWRSFLATPVSPPAATGPGQTVQGSPGSTTYQAGRDIIMNAPAPALSTAPTPRASPGHLIQNGSFEQGLEHWGTGWLEEQVGNRAVARRQRFLAFNGARANWFPSPEGRRPGSTCLRVEHETAYAPNVFSTLSQAVALRRSRNYEASFWVRTEHVDGPGGFVLRIAPSREDRPDLWDSVKVQVPPGPSDWREYRLRFNSGDEERYDVRFSAEGRVRAWIADVTLRPLGG